MISYNWNTSSAPFSKMGTDNPKHSKIVSSASQGKFKLPLSPSICSVQRFLWSKRFAMGVQILHRINRASCTHVGGLCRELCGEDRAEGGPQPLLSY